MLTLNNADKMGNDINTLESNLELLYTHSQASR